MASATPSTTSLPNPEALIIQTDDLVPAVNENSAAHWMVCTLLSYRPFNRNNMMDILVGLWELVSEPVIQPLDNKVSLIKFEDKQDKEKVLNGAPWYFNRCMVLFEPYNLDKRPSDYTFQHADLWVRVHGVPHRFMTESAAERIGNGIGKFLSFDSELLDEGWGVFLRIRIRILINKPLIKEIKLSSGNNTLVDCEIKYERLPSLCFKCGCLNHTESICTDPTCKDMVSNFPFSDSLRASPSKPGSRGFRRPILTFANTRRRLEFNSTPGTEASSKSLNLADDGSIQEVTYINGPYLERQIVKKASKNATPTPSIKGPISQSPNPGPNSGDTSIPPLMLKRKCPDLNQNSDLPSKNRKA